MNTKKHQIGTGTLQEVAPFGLGFGEDGALELRSSTEELYFMEPEKGMTEREKPSQQVTLSHSFIFTFIFFIIINDLFFPIIHPSLLSYPLCNILIHIVHKKASNLFKQFCAFVVLHLL